MRIFGNLLIPLYLNGSDSVERSNDEYMHNSAAVPGKYTGCTTPPRC